MLRLASTILALLIVQGSIPGAVSAASLGADRWTGRFLACYKAESGITPQQFQTVIGNLANAELERYTRTRSCALLRAIMPEFDNTEYKIYPLDPQPTRKTATDIMREMESRFGVPFGAIPLSADRVMLKSAITPNDHYYPQQWGLPKIAAPLAWEETTGSESVVIAVLDSGIDYTHLQLRSQIWENSGENPSNNIDDDQDGYIDNRYGINSVLNSGDPIDTDGHGTIVAGVIGAKTNDADGIAGTNWNVDLMAVNIFQIMSGELVATSFASVQGIDWVVRRKVQFGDNVRVINASWGSPGQDDAVRLAIESARDAGILFVAATGNSAGGNNNDTAPRYPANYSTSLSNVIAVAATDSNDNLASFSHYGVTSVQIAAPGVDIVSTYLNNQHAMVSGTSVAAPFVSGALALLFAAHPEFSAIEAEAALLSSVDIVPALNGKVQTSGRLNIANMLAIADSIAAQYQLLAQSKNELNLLVGDVGKLKKNLLVPLKSVSTKAKIKAAKKVVAQFLNRVKGAKSSTLSNSILALSGTDIEGDFADVLGLIKSAKGKKATKTKINGYCTSIKSLLNQIVGELS